MFGAVDRRVFEDIGKPTRNMLMLIKNKDFHLQS